MKAPFPYFGGKSKVSKTVWSRFGNIPNYIEPFAGSLAVLLGRPTAPKTETINDADCYLSNFWRSLSSDPEGLAREADWPVNEADLLARHKWLIAQKEFRDRMRTDPFYYDLKIAGWWVWGLCSWIGQDWCYSESEQLPHLGNAGMGINRKLPHLGDAGRGINRKLPHLGDAGRDLSDYFSQLSNRLRKVRVACGDWIRVVGESVTIKHGTTGVFLDPPYSGKRNQSYNDDRPGLAQEVFQWAVENGNNPLYRISVCGYEGDYDFPDPWEKIEWKANGGYGNQADLEGRENSHKERIWFSPYCLKPAKQQSLF
jgi:DNA adenine methylase